MYLLSARDSRTKGSNGQDDEALEGADEMLQGNIAAAGSQR